MVNIGSSADMMCFDGFWEATTRNPKDPHFISASRLNPVPLDDLSIGDVPHRRPVEKIRCEDVEFGGGE